MVIGPAASSPKVNQSKITLNLEPLNPDISHLFSFGNMLFRVQGFWVQRFRVQRLHPFDMCWLVVFFQPGTSNPELLNLFFCKFRGCISPPIYTLNFELEIIKTHHLIIKHLLLFLSY